MSQHETTVYSQVIAIIAALFSGGGIMGVFNFIQNRKKASAETILIKANADHIVVGSAMDFVKELRAEATAIRTRAEAQERRIDILEEHVRLQLEIIRGLRAALAVYNPEHELLKQSLPQSP